MAVAVDIDATAQAAEMMTTGAAAEALAVRRSACYRAARPRAMQAVPAAALMVLTLMHVVVVVIVIAMVLAMAMVIRRAIVATTTTATAQAAVARRPESSSWRFGTPHR